MSSAEAEWFCVGVTAGKISWSVLTVHPAKTRQVRKVNTRVLIVSTSTLGRRQGTRQEVNNQIGSAIQENKFTTDNTVLEFGGKLGKIR